MQKENYIKQILNLGDNQFECVFETEYDNKHIILLHPTDAPKDIMFVAMYVNEEEQLVPIINQMIAERMLSLYTQSKQNGLSYKSDE